MQLGLYLHLLLQMFGVQSLRVLDSYHILDTPPSVSPGTIHREGHLDQLFEPCAGVVLSRRHGGDNGRECFARPTFLGKEWILDKEGDHSLL